MSIYKVEWCYVDSFYTTYSKLFTDEAKAIIFLEKMRNHECAYELEHIKLVTLVERDGELIDDVTLINAWPAHESYERFAEELRECDERELAERIENDAYNWAELTEAALLGIRLRY